MQGKSILIVDDEEVQLLILEKQLRREGLTVFQAANGDEAFASATQNSVDVIFSDVRMPGSDGFDLAQKIFESDLPTPFGFMTGFWELDVPLAHHLGVRMVLKKPFDRKDFIAAVRTLLTPQDEFFARTIPSPPVASLNGEHESPSEDQFCLGFGGFFLASEQRLANNDELVKFDFKFRSGSLTNFSGIARVLWYRKDSAPGTGLAIEYLDPQCLAAFLQWQQQTKPRSFIPQGCGTP